MRWLAFAVVLGGFRMQIKSATPAYLVSVTTDTATTSIMMITVR